MLEGLRSELYKLQIKPGRANVAMSERPMPKVEIITEPARVEKLKMIAKAYTSGSITREQAAILASKV